MSRHTTTGAIVFSDLDRTLVYSPSALLLEGADESAPRLLCIEVHDGRPLSFVTETAAAALATLARSRRLVPATTRTVEQYRRIHLPGPPPAYAICANGGRLLADGVEDADWSRAVVDALATTSAPLPEILEQLAGLCTPRGEDPFVDKVRQAADLFCYVVVKRSRVPAGWIDEVTGVARERGWEVSLQGRKVYLTPAGLDKAHAAAEVVARLGATTTSAAGDSLLDAALLETADAAIVPRHGELIEVGWSAPRAQVTRHAGVLAGEEIAAWMMERLAPAQV
ncbi:HAD family hydrolase [Lapillicoccus sp.]|uniref:HAD family hydrolase n=1 Tax=Lapillicoccus sp. TaxID=1909287 RepID=UPI0025F5CE81|nr:HAD family hydrolase [Lapillicoccus sp.]